MKHFFSFFNFSFDVFSYLFSSLQVCIVSFHLFRGEGNIGTFVLADVAEGTDFLSKTSFL